MTVRDLKNCITSSNGKTYCYDSRRKKYIEIAERELKSYREMPDDVVEKFLEIANRGGKK